METPVFVATFTLTVADYVRGYLFHFERFVRWFCWPIGALGGAMLLSALSPPVDAPPQSVIPSLELIGLAAAFPFLLIVSAAIQFRDRNAATKTTTWTCFPDRLECATAL